MTFERRNAVVKIYREPMGLRRLDWIAIAERLLIHLAKPKAAAVRMTKTA
jgi:hypothetical protein